MTTRTRVAAAAPSWVRARLAGGPREVAVIHSGLHAIYVAADDNGASRCLGVLSRSSSVVPCGLRTLLPDLSSAGQGGHLPGAGDRAIIHDGHLLLGALDVSVGRIVDMSAPALDPAAAATMAGDLRAVLGGRLEPVRDELSAASLALLARGAAGAVALLLGRGSGLTPVGDDVLAGWLAVMRAAGAEPLEVVATVARLAPGATTMLSMTLLERADAGDVLPEFRHLLLTLRAHGTSRSAGRADHAALKQAVNHMLAIGHTSGSGLMLGSLLAFDSIAGAAPIPPSIHQLSARSSQP